MLPDLDVFLLHRLRKAPIDVVVIKYSHSVSSNHLIPLLYDSARDDQVVSVIVDSSARVGLPYPKAVLLPCF